MKIPIATVGDNCIDRYLPPVDRTLVGGNAVNVAVNFSRAGYAASYFGAVGDDAEGVRTRTVLASLGVDVSSLTTICVRPSRSRRSMNVSGPKSRFFATHPISTTSRPTCVSRSSPHVCVRSKFPKVSNIKTT